MKTALEWKQYYSTAEFKDNYIYNKNDLGAACTDTGASFKLWSPAADSVTLNLYSEGDGGKVIACIPMKKEEKGIWSWHTGEDLHGIYYDYVLDIEGEQIRSADPYARACGINGRRSMAVDLRRTDPEGWKDDRAPEEGRERIIYELHVKEFSWDKSGGFPEEYRGKYKAFTCGETTLYNDGIHPTGLKYLKDLGVTHIEIMPAYDYGSVDEAGDDAQFNWGYDPVNYNVPEGSYATDARHGEVRIREMKEMIQALHASGFGVILDVVYNHTHSLDSWFQRTAPWYFYRVFDDGRISNGSACGNDVASEREMCAKYILESVLYWAEEYHIDGFRFDLMGLLDVDLMNRIRRELDIRYGKGVKILFGEPWAAQETAIENGAPRALRGNINLLDENIGMFCDLTRDAVKGSALKIKRPGFITGARGYENDIAESVSAWGKTGISSIKGETAPAKAPSQIITYVSSHDNQTLWDKLGETAAEEERMRLNRMAAAVYMTCQGTLFLLSGEEFARTKNGMEDSFNAPVSLNRLDWELAWKNRDLVEYYKGLIGLRRQLPGLCDKTRRAAGRIDPVCKSDGIVSFIVDNRSENCGSKWDRLWIIYNSTKREIVAEPEGKGWEILCDALDSAKWKHSVPAAESVTAAAQSVLILGHRTDCAASGVGMVHISPRIGDKGKWKKSGQRQKKEWQEEKDAV